MRKLSDKELDAVCGGNHRGSSNFQWNDSFNVGVVVLSKDTNLIQGSNINGGVIQIA